jgi:hypothetical protein
MRTAIDGALIRNRKQLLLRLKPINAGEATLRFILLKCDEDKRHKCRLLRQPTATAHTKFALSIE